MHTKPINLVWWWWIGKHVTLQTRNVLGKVGVNPISIQSIKENYWNSNSRIARCIFNVYLPKLIPTHLHQHIGQLSQQFGGICFVRYFIIYRPYILQLCQPPLYTNPLTSLPKQNSNKLNCNVHKDPDLLNEIEKQQAIT